MKTPIFNYKKEEQDKVLVKIIFKNCYYHRFLYATARYLSLSQHGAQSAS